MGASEDSVTVDHHPHAARLFLPIENHDNKRLAHLSTLLRHLEKSRGCLDDSLAYILPRQPGGPLRMITQVVDHFTDHNITLIIDYRLVSPQGSDTRDMGRGHACPLHGL